MAPQPASPGRATVCALILVLMAGVASAQTGTLVTRLLPPAAGGRNHYSVSGRNLEDVFSLSNAQTVYLYEPVAGQGIHVAGFTDAVKTEPEEYRGEKPARGVVTLGDRTYGLVLDQSRGKAYDLLLLDRNGNGDLTDDEVVRGKADTGIFSAGTACEFPAIAMTIEAGGEPLEYQFFVFSETWPQEEGEVVLASFRAGVYQDGVVNLNGKMRRLVLVDYNSNGRFDDAMTIDQEIRGSDGAYWLPPGDLLFVDPERDMGSVYIGSVIERDDCYPVSRTVSVDGAFYDLEVAAAGDRVTLTPVAGPLGLVENRNTPWRALVLGEQGPVEIACAEPGPVLLPAGEWRLLSYEIDLSAKVGPVPKKGSLFGRLFGLGASGGPTRVKAAATTRCAPVTVAAGKTTALPFGPPYRPVVHASADRQEGTVWLTLAIEGAGGEVCDDLRIAGDRPQDPSFTITNAAGDVVERDAFEYG